jgi:hypothetical protein
MLTTDETRRWVNVILREFDLAAAVVRRSSRVQSPSLPLLMRVMRHEAGARAVTS